LAEWSKALASGASPQGRGFEPHSCHHLESFSMRRIRQASSLPSARQRRPGQAVEGEAPVRDRSNLAARSSRDVRRSWLVSRVILHSNIYDPGRTRTCNPRLRGLMPYPLGHGAFYTFLEIEYPAVRCLLLFVFRYPPRSPRAFGSFAPFSHSPEPRQPPPSVGLLPLWFRRETSESLARRVCRFGRSA
jgi:hypothetical protein